ncbi:MAG: carboxylating nicotinate-nucleotide diphosphorylase [Bacteroidota bacterium]|nr:carboxylating nicotinate-nucleotide diphosphorylase [Bacteroidota bacterium]
MSLAEDIGGGDYTSLACIPENKRSEAKLFIKDEGILAGLTLAEDIFLYIDPTLKCSFYRKDGDAAVNGDIAMKVSGNLRNILMAERLVLNCIQRMSGIATRTGVLAGLIEGLHAKLLDTRKTTPGLRFLEKWAVRIGGGYNHRFGLYDMVMIKDNHVDGVGGTRNAIEAVTKYLKENALALKVEIEVRNQNELDEVLSVGGIDRIMLDNYSPAALAEAVKLINGKYETEASGGINEDNIRKYAMTGVDFISSSAMTHSVKSLDLSLKVSG